jgi:mannosyl-3-phosphoglycerate phosphatase
VATSRRRSSTGHGAVPETGRLPILFTDLDGTLLDHQSYSFDAARDALARIRRARVPLVLCSSKTRMEIEGVQEQLDSFHPFVSENGAAVFIPPAYFPFPIAGARERAGYHVLEFGRPYHEVVDLLHCTAARVKVPVVGFSDMSVREVADACALSMRDARLATRREYDEPFRVVNGNPASRDRLVRALRRAGLRCVKGGRFDHVTGCADKGTSVAALQELYRRAHGAVVSVGLGDSLNDVSLLRAVEIPVVIRNRGTGDAAHLVRKVPAARVSRAYGPTGWNEAVNAILAECGIGRAGAR